MSIKEKLESLGRNSIQLKIARKEKVPVVLMDRSFQDEEFDCVGIDNQTAAFRAVNHPFQQ